MNQTTFSEQAVEFLNTYWRDVGDQAEFIFSVALRVFKEADMHRQGVTASFKYAEGSSLDFPAYLYFYERLVNFAGNHPEWRDSRYDKSTPYEVSDPVKHKRDLKQKLDVDSDVQISFLEYLLYQYKEFCDPALLKDRAMKGGAEDPAVAKARSALCEVDARIQGYEQEGARLEEGAKLPGDAGLKFKQQLGSLDRSAQADLLKAALASAEAAVRLAVKSFQGPSGSSETSGGAPKPSGALWWMERDLEEKMKYKLR